jgi:hypothetical protein
MPLTCGEEVHQIIAKRCVPGRVVTIQKDRFIPRRQLDVILSRGTANPTRLKTLLCKGFQPFRFGAGIATLCTDEVARNGAQLRNFGQRSQKRPLHSLQSPPPALPLSISSEISNFRSQRCRSKRCRSLGCKTQRTRSISEPAVFRRRSRNTRFLSRTCFGDR